MLIRQVMVANLSKVLSDDQIAFCLPAIEADLAKNFCRDWGLSAPKLALHAPAIPADPATAWIVVFDHSSVAGTVGVHEFGQNGMPHGSIGILDAVGANIPWTVALDHELKEMLVNPSLQETYFLQTTTTEGKIYPKEVCDPVEFQTYKANALVVLSNYVLPSYFDLGNVTDSAPQGPFDYLEGLKAPLPALAPGGYMSVWDTAQPGWNQLTGAMGKLKGAVNEGSRLWRLANGMRRVSTHEIFSQVMEVGR